MNKLFPIVLATCSTLLLSNPFYFMENILYGDKYITSATFECYDEKSSSFQLGFTEIERSDFCANIVELGKSRTVLNIILDNFEKIPELLTSSNDTKNREYYIVRLRELLTIEPIKNTDMYTVSIDSYLPNNDAVLLINTFLQAIIKVESERKNKELNNQIIFLENQISKRQKELEDIERSLQIFQERNDIFSLDTNTQLLLDSGVDESKVTHLPRKVLQYYRLLQDLKNASDAYLFIMEDYQISKNKRELYRSPIRIVASPNKEIK